MANADEARMRAIAHEEFQRSSGKSQFNVADIPYHTHNGDDSPSPYMGQATYVGTVNSTGRPFRNLPFPEGWFALKSNSFNGRYRIVHSLNTLNYSVVLTQLYTTATNPAPAWGFVLVLNPNYFDVQFVAQSVATPVTDPVATDTAFSFYMTNISNSSNNMPTYISLPPSQT